MYRYYVMAFSEQKDHMQKMLDPSRVEQRVPAQRISYFGKISKWSLSK